MGRICRIHDCQCTRSSGFYALSLSFLGTLLLLSTTTRRIILMFWRHSVCWFNKGPIWCISLTTGGSRPFICWPHLDISSVFSKSSIKEESARYSCSSDDKDEQVTAAYTLLSQLFKTQTPNPHTERNILHESCSSSPYDTRITTNVFGIIKGASVLTRAQSNEEELLT